MTDADISPAGDAASIPGAAHGAHPLVCVRGVSFAYGAGGAPEVLSGIELCLDEGLFLGIIGPNGGGKTTLLKLLLGVLTPSRGTVEIAGQSPAKTRVRRALLGYVPQYIPAHPHFPATVTDVVEMGGYGKAGLFRRPGADTRRAARELIAEVGLATLAARPIGTLSGGEQQRVYLARALVHDPRVLILDEPTAGLDSGGQEQFAALLGTLHREKKLTVIMVSHDVSAVMHLADSIACLDHTLHWHGAPADLDAATLSELYHCEMSAYLTHFTEESLGDGP